MIEFTRKATGISLAALLAALGAGAGLAQDTPGNAADAFNIPADVKILGSTDLGSRKPTAIVNGTLITGTDVDQRTALVIAASGNKDVPADEVAKLRMQILRQLIDETLQIQEAKALDIAVAKDEIDESYNKLAADRFAMAPDALERYLAQAGSSTQSLRRQVEGELAWDRILRRNVAPFVNVSAGEVNELYERLQASKGSAQYRIAEIFLSATPSTHDAVMENAKSIVDKIRKGGNVASYARQYSEASTAAVGGDLGWISLAQLQNQKLEEVAQQLNPGQLVGPIEVPGGFDILYLVDKRQVGMADPRDTTMSLKQISLDFPPTLVEAEARAKTEAFQQGVASMRGCGDADAVAARIGAAVVTNDQIRVRDLPEALQSVMLQLGVGQTTPPFGSLKEGVRVLMLCGRDEPQDTSIPSTQQLMARLQDDRIQKRAQRYMRDLRRDAVIEYN
ncbi:MAG: peptidylprolyl isomerase [Croceibacterium sp.]